MKTTLIILMITTSGPKEMEWDFQEPKACYSMMKSIEEILSGIHEMAGKYIMKCIPSIHDLDG